MEQLLADCGAGPATLSADQRAALDADGYLLLRGVVERAWLGELRAALEAALASPPPDAEVAHKTGTRHADGLPWKGEAFDGVWTHPAALAAAYHVLGRPFQLLFLGGRDPTRGRNLVPNARRSPRVVTTPRGTGRGHPRAGAPCPRRR